MACTDSFCDVAVWQRSCMANALFSRPLRIPLSAPTPPPLHNTPHSTLVHLGYTSPQSAQLFAKRQAARVSRQQRTHYSNALIILDATDRHSFRCCRRDSLLWLPARPPRVCSACISIGITATTQSCISSVSRSIASPAVAATRICTVDLPNAFLFTVSRYDSKYRVWLDWDGVRWTGLECGEIEWGGEKEIGSM